MKLLEEAFTKPRGKAVGLCSFAALQVVWGALLLQATDQQSSGESGAEFSESMWESWTYVADPGTHADEFTWLRRAMSFTITVSGILLFAVVVFATYPVYVTRSFVVLGMHSAWMGVNNHEVVTA